MKNGNSRSRIKKENNQRVLVAIHRLIPIQVERKEIMTEQLITRLSENSAIVNRKEVKQILASCLIDLVPYSETIAFKNFEVMRMGMLREIIENALRIDVLKVSVNGDNTKVLYIENFIDMNLKTYYVFMPNSLLEFIEDIKRGTDERALRGC